MALGKSEKPKTGSLFGNQESGSLFGNNNSGQGSLFNPPKKAEDAPQKPIIEKDSLFKPPANLFASPKKPTVDTSEETGDKKQPEKEPKKGSLFDQKGSLFTAGAPSGSLNLFSKPADKSATKSREVTQTNFSASSSLKEREKASPFNAPLSGQPKSDAQESSVKPDPVISENPFLSSKKDQNPFLNPASGNKNLLANNPFQASIFQAQDSQNQSAQAPIKRYDPPSPFMTGNSANKVSSSSLFDENAKPPTIQPSSANDSAKAKMASSLFGGANFAKSSAPQQAPVP